MQKTWHVKCNIVQQVCLLWPFWRSWDCAASCSAVFGKMLSTARWAGDVFSKVCRSHKNDQNSYSDDGDDGQQNDFILRISSIMTYDSPVFSLLSLCLIVFYIALRLPSPGPLSAAAAAQQLERVQHPANSMRRANPITSITRYNNPITWFQDGHNQWNSSSHALWLNDSDYMWLLVTPNDPWFFLAFGRTTRDAQQHQHDARLGGAKGRNGRNWWRFGMFRWNMMICLENKHISGMKLYNFTWFDLRSLTLSHIFRYLPTILPILPTSFPFPFPFANAGGPRFRIAQATQVSRETARSGPMEVESKGRQGRPLPDFRFQIIILYR